MIPTVWLSLNETPARCRWDQDFADWLLPTSIFDHEGQPETGAVVVYPAGENAEQIGQLNDYLARLDWVVLLLTSDECSSFPFESIQHKNIRIWVQSPRPVRHEGQYIRHLPVGAPAFTVPDRTNNLIDVGFIGQITHKAREDMAAAFENSELDFSINKTAGFTEGLPRDAYLRFMARTKVAPCPSGPCSADTFRLWEALELGCVPIVDTGPVPDPLGRAQADYPKGFWKLLWGQEPPFPVVKEWSEAPALARVVLDEWPASSNRVFAAYQQHKRILQRRLLNDVAEVSGKPLPGSAITCVIPTSPVPSNPSTTHLETTIQSVRERLPDSEILVMFDGVRSEQEHLRLAYEDYQRDVLWKCNHVWKHVTPIRFDTHLHQAEMLRRTLREVDTPTVLFVEHDTPLVGDIPFGGWVQALLDDKADLIRTYHETILQPEHMHLMGRQVGDYLPTHQFSARPHLAKTDWYRETLYRYFSQYAKSMIEDRLHGAAQDEPENFRMLLYTPPGNIQRSTHLDARGSEEKFEMVF